MKQRRASEPQRIAVIGAAGRLPSANDLEEYWQLLLDGRVVAAEPEQDRRELWSAARNPELAAKLTTLRAGYLKHVTQFDAECFNVSPREAARLDPQQRLLLEVTHDALEDAGLTRSLLQQRRVGVFIGAGSVDHMLLQATHKAEIDAYYGTGNSHNLLAGRLSYYLNLKGPSLAVDTACSSSLTALHLAAQALRAGDIEVAIVGGVNVIVAPDLTLAFSEAKMLSPSGRCKTFSAAADGYGRAEGVGVVILRGLEEAEAEGCRVRCLLRSCAINQDGRSNGIAAPNGQSQIAVIREALERAGIEPALVAYIEAHGTGTRLGDAIELAALQRVFAQPEKHCYVGSVKSNIGHAEAAAGICGLLKAMLMLEHGLIPPHPVPGPYIEPLSADRGQLRVTQNIVELDPARPFIGISSFGFGGSNAHVILERWHEERGKGSGTRPANDERRPILLALSSHLKHGTRDDALELARFLEASRAPLGDVAATLMLRREHLRFRRAHVVQGRAKAIESLRASDATNERASEVGEQRPKLVFAFTGQGSQYAGMGQSLYENVQVFREAFDECNAWIRRSAELSLVDVLYRAERANDALLVNTHLAQLALFGFEYALARLWEGVGLAPDYAIGHSVGEIVAHAVAGSLSLGDAVSLVNERGRLMQGAGAGEADSAGTGAMLAVSLGVDAVGDLLHRLELPLYLAAVNARRRVVVSGARRHVTQLRQYLELERVPCRELATRHAFHSAGFDAAAQALSKATSGLQTRVGRIPVAGNLDGHFVRPGSLGPAYWARHITSAVRFKDGVDELLAAGARVFLEIGPDGVLSKLILDDHASELRAIPSMVRGADSERTVLEAAGRLYELGFELDFARLLPLAGRTHCALPARRLSRKQYWAFPPEPAPASSEGETAQASQREAGEIALAVVDEPVAAGEAALSDAVLQRLIAQQMDVMSAQLRALAEFPLGNPMVDMASPWPGRSE